MSAVTLPVAATPSRAGRREWFGLAVLFLPTLLVAIDNTVLGFALPAIIPTRSSPPSARRIRSIPAS